MTGKLLQFPEKMKACAAGCGVYVRPEELIEGWDACSGDCADEIYFREGRKLRPGYGWD